MRSTSRNGTDLLSQWTGQFVNPELEQDFLQTQTREINRQLEVCGLAVALLGGLHLLADWIDEGHSLWVLATLTVVRLALLGIGLGAWWATRQRQYSSSEVHHITLALGVVLLATVSVPILLGTYDPMVLAGWNIAYFLTISLFIPVNALGRNLLYAVLLGRYGLQVALNGWPDQAGTTTVLIFAGFLFGQITAVVHGHRKRREFVLLRRTFPVQVVKRMMEGEEIHDQAQSASVLFADLVGFTSWSAARSSMEVVRALDILFSGFDTLAAKNGVEPIKTIGDCYMVASGVLDPEVDHAERLAALAMDMQRYIAKTEAFGQPMELRIGIHTGPLSAGVIHCQRQTYDVWGDTVNAAARIQSSAAPSTTRVSAATAKCLSARFTTETQGDVHLKGLGAMTVYELKGEAAADRRS